MIGSRATIERFQRDQLVRSVERQYTGANLIVGAAEALDAVAPKADSTLAARP